MTPTTRHETNADREAVRHVNRLASGRDNEDGIVDVLRSGGYVRVSLVAEVNYLLVKAGDISKAVAALRAAGHPVEADEVVP